MPREICQIAKDIKTEWKTPYFGAVPYLDAMMHLKTINDTFFCDSASNIINYFLCNAMHFRGIRAKELKQELKAILHARRD